MTSPPKTLTRTTDLGTWRLTRAGPGPEQAGIVQEYWEVEGRLSPFREALLPNGSVEVMINLGPPHRVFEGRGAGIWNGSWFSGLQERSIFIETLEGTHLVSARLHPLGATELFGPAAAKAANSIVELATLIGAEAAALRERLLAAALPETRFALLEAFLQSRGAEAAPPPEFVGEAASRIERAHGNLRVATLYQELGISRKHLAVSFTRSLGLSAKAYARIHRFLWTLEYLRQHEAVEWSRLALLAGYSDQSHLVRDFRRVGAASPREYLRRMAPDGDALLEVAG